MEFLAANVIVFFTIYFIYWIIKEFRINRNLPPGPWAALPWIGTSSRLNQTQPHVTLTEWKEKYGDVFSFTQLGGTKTIVVNDEKSIREVLLGPSADDLAARPQSFRSKLLRPGRSGIAFGDDSPAWRSMKRAMLTSLKMFGEGLDRLEETTINVINDISDKFAKHGKEPFNPNYLLSQCTAKIIGTLTYGSIPSKEEITLFSVIEEQDTALLVPGGLGSELDYLPWLRFIMRDVYKEIMKVVELHWFLFDGLMKRRQAECDLSDPKCALDSLFAIQNQIMNDPRVPEEDKLTDADVHLMTRDIIIAGTVTTHRALLSLIAILTAHPHVQRALQEEVDRVCGQRQPLVADKFNMPYTVATIWELFRYGSEVPTCVPHVASRETTVAGYKVPKGAQIWCNVWNLHHDERYWDEPWEFRPERYLDEGGQIIPVDHPIKTRTLQFGAGRRACPGEHLARNRIFLFVATFMQKFTFHPAPGNDAPKHDPRDYGPGLTLIPTPYKISVEERL